MRVVWLEILTRLRLDSVSLLHRKLAVLSRNSTVPSQLSPMSQAYPLAQLALQHCYSTYLDGDLTLEEYLVLKQAVQSVLFRSLAPNHLAPNHIVPNHKQR